MSLFTDGLEFVGKNIASGALSWVGGQAAGWVLGDLFGTNGPSTQDVLDAIGNLGKQLTNIQNTLATIETQLTDEFADIEAALAVIHQEELYNAWQQVNDNIVTYKTQINSQYSTYVEYANAAPVKPPPPARYYCARAADTGYQQRREGVSQRHQQLRVRRW
jgi:hypothetical protein